MDGAGASSKARPSSKATVQIRRFVLVLITMAQYLLVMSKIL